MNPAYSLVADRAGHRCEYCLAPECVFNFPFEVEHILPASQGGKNQDENLALACRSCNLRKATHVEFEDDATGGVVGLFNPRTHLWSSHFVANRETARIEGQTSIGRATVACL